MKLPDAMHIAGVDRVDLYLIGTTSHDGTAALRVHASPIQVLVRTTTAVDARSHWYRW